MNTQVAIVTGASKGIGKATAIRLAKDFSAVIVVARNSDALASTAAEVEAVGAHAHPVAVDLKDPLAAQEVVAQAIQRFKRIDALVNIAGAVPQSDLFAMTDTEWEEGMALKFHGARRLTLAAWDCLRQSRGAVILTSGASALTPKPAFAAVGAINAAIAALAKAFSERGIDEGVQVNSVLPGPVMTDRRQAMLSRYAEAHGISAEAATREFAAQAHIARYGTPAEIADLIAFLVSPSARWLTGAAVRMDGGESKAI
jgi:3-oxoacyl-[acyl-carrier protein] reductase